MLVMLFAVWLVLSGHFDLLHLAFGLVCSALVAQCSSALLFTETPSRHLVAATWGAVRFLPWLLYEIVVANVHLVYLVCRPRRLRPQVVRFRTELRGDVARVFLGNAITLTPGTITLDIVGDEFIVHAVSDQSAASLLSGEMERRIGQALNPSAEAPRDGSRG
jgi:multicomponent Na+:H+ antiporter subunit E